MYGTSKHKNNSFVEDRMNTNLTITLDHTGPETGAFYRGKFTFKPNITKRESLAADEFRRRALGFNSSEAPSKQQTDAFICGQLYAHIIDAPKFWKESDSGLDLPDGDNVIYAIYDAMLAEIAKAKEEKAKEAEARVKELD